MRNEFSLTRRAFLGLSTAATAAGALPGKLWALTVGTARALVVELVGELYDLINSGLPEARMYGELEDLLERYADMPIIARSVLGVDWRRASDGQRREFTRVLQGYISRKYGSHFRELIGGDIEVTGARQGSNYVEVTSTVILRSEPPVSVVWHVSDRIGPRVFNLVIGGINLRTTEAEEIGAMLDRNGGNIDAMIADLRTAG